MKSKIKLILALGNPGEEYEKTYHNAGALFIGYISDKQKANPANGASWKEEKLFNHRYAELGGSKVLIAQTRTFMNESGKAVKAVAEKFRLKPDQIAIAHDDSDIKLGEYKISFGRSSAGHKGAESAIRALKTKDFWRIRIGIRSGKGKALDFVLKKIGKPASEKLEKVFKEITEAAGQHL